MKSGKMRNLLIILIFILFNFNLHAEITAHIDRNEVNLGDSINLTISSDKQLAGSPDFSVLESDFQISRPSQSQSFVMRNGKSQINLAWTITLFPLKEGEIIIPSFEIDNQKTLPLLVKVTQTAQTNHPQDDIFITAEISKNTLYIGEQAIIKAKIFSSVRILSGKLVAPKINGVELEQFGDEKNYQSTQNNKTYQVFERNYLFSPTKSGQITIDSASLLADIQQSNYQRRRITRVSPPLQIEVLDKPADYPNTPWLPSRAVTLQENWSDDNFYQAGTPITRTLILSAQGLGEEQLPDLSQLPELTQLPNIKVYVDNSDSQTDIDTDEIVSTQTTKFAMIPEKAGEITLPAYQLTWFNTETGEIEVITLPEKKLTVVPATGTQNNNQTAPSNNQITNQQATNNSDEIETEIDDQLNIEQQIEIETLTRSLRFWQIISGVLALLLCAAIATASILFRQKSTTPIINHTPQKPTDFSQAYYLLASDNAKDKQLGLIEWWNLKYTELPINNLSQLAEQLDDKTVISALNSLENSLYAKGIKDNTTWLDWVKNGKIKPKLSVIIEENKLKPLYSR